MRTRWICAATLTLVLMGATAYTGGAALYLRSASYRSACAATLSEHLGLPADIGGVTPRSRTTRSFQDVEVWLPQRRDRALHCDEATVILRPTPADPDGYEIEIVGGAAEISTRTWMRSDYRSVIESGLRPGFAPDGPRRVRFSNMDLRFERDQFRATLSRASGAVSFEEPGRGVLRVLCRALNGYEPVDPAVLSASFSPRAAGMRVDALELSVPAIPLRAVGLQQLANLDARSGTFSGKLRYAESDAGRQVGIAGRCTGLQLAELTGGLLPRAIRGACPEIELQELTALNRVPQRLRFRGILRQVELGDLLGLLGWSAIGGRADFDVGAAEISQQGIRRFVASGACEDISVAGVTDALGMGVMTGRLRMRIGDLAIEDNRIRTLDAELEVAPSDDAPDYVEGRLVRELVSRALHVELPPLLPERIEYSRLGVRIEVRDEVLTVFGSHGERNQVILTVRLYGAELPLIREPKSSFDLRPTLDALRASAAAALETRWREWEEQLRAAGTGARTD